LGTCISKSQGLDVGSGTSCPSARTGGRGMATLRPPSSTSLGTVPGRRTLGLMRIPRAAERGAILLQHRIEHAQAGSDHQFEEFGFVSTSSTSGRVRTSEDSTVAIGRAMRDFSWRLLVGGLAPAASHHSCTTSSEEPPLSNVNSQWDIPRPGRASRLRVIAVCRHATYRPSLPYRG
jgi:hypothetical protein